MKSIAPELGSPDFVPERALDGASRKIKMRMLVICQIFGLAALAVVVYAAGGNNYRILKYVAFFAPMILIIPKPNLIPYFFILSFFTVLPVYVNGLAFSVFVTDVMFLLIIIAFFSNRKNIDLKAAFEKQRFLATSLIVFVLWAIFGFFVNFYTRSGFENMASLLYIYNFFVMTVMVILFSLSQWKEHRDKFIRFYVICSFCEIVVALMIEVLHGARTFSDFHKFTGTLGVNHGLMGIFLVLSFGVASCAFFELRGKTERLFSLFVAFLSVGALLLSGSRGVILGILLAIPVFIVLFVRARWIISAAVLTAVTVFVLVDFSPQNISKITNVATRVLLRPAMNSASSVDMSAYGRFLIWERVYEHAMYGPWAQKIIGIGVGSFTTLKFSYYLEAGTFTTGAHNNFLHVFVEAGIVGIIIFAAIFISIIRKLLLKSRYQNNAAKCFILCTLILLFSGLTQETFWFNGAFGRFWFHYMFFYLMIFNFQDEERFVLKKEGENEIAYRKADF